jgi:hypothetical protein
MHIYMKLSIVANVVILIHHHFESPNTIIERNQQGLGLLAMKQLKSTGVFCFVIGTDRIF